MGLGDWANAIGGIATGLIDAAQSKKMWEETKEREDNQLQRMMADAKAAGIHPVAALGAGGKYSNTQSVIGTPGAGLGSAIGQGISELGAIASRDKLGLENDVLASQVQKNDAEAAVANATSRSIMQSVQSQTRQAALAEAYPNAMFVPGNTREPDFGMQLAGLPEVVFNPGQMTLAETAEEFGGEPGEWLQGTWNLMQYLGRAIPMGIDSYLRNTGLGQYLPGPRFQRPYSGRSSSFLNPPVPNYVHGMPYYTGGGF